MPLRHVRPDAPPPERARSRIRPLRAALLLLAGLLAAAPAHAQERATVSGTVTDAGSGSPVEGIIVRAAGPQQAAATTGADGRYRLELAPGSYSLVASRVGAVVGRASVAAAAGQTATRDFRVDAGSGIDIDALVVVGSRRPDRSVLSAPVPVDVVTSEEIQQTGLTETAQIIQRLAPSVNFPRATIADGTDHVRPATLRGLAPDQLLVLLNGKRRHGSALVNVNGTVGRGSTAVDLNAIPPSAIERIEILREGAAAQYGSDAIAGVVNIVLKSGGGSRVSSTLGQTAEDDGRVVQVGGGIGRDIGAEGFFNLTADYRDRGFTNRSYADTRQQYFAGDPRNTDPGLSGQVNHRQGDAEATDAGAFLNAALPLGASAVSVYGFGGITRREGEAAGFFRRALDDRTVRAIHPNGFLPMIGTEIWDGSGTGGVRGSLLGWGWDLSAVYGRNTFRFDIGNSNNVTLGTASPTDFYAGTLGFSQLTGNLDLVRQFAVGLATPVNVAAGAEYRLDSYWIEAGEPDSYRDGGVRVLDGPNRGAQAQLGAQVFPGFRPTDEVDADRDNVAAYLDLEANLLPSLLVTVAGRAERYSDFGSTSDGRVAARFEPLRGFAVRGSAGTGFRAPSLAQSYFSATATNFVVVNGVNTPFEVRTLPVSSREAQVLGARKLQPEESVNLSLGVTLNPVPGLSATVDFYRIDIDDRIVLSGNFLGAPIRALFEQQGLRGVGGGRFFTNAIDTRTYGVDVVLNYGVRVGGEGRLRLTAGYNHNETEVLAVASTPPQLTGFQETLFDRVERGRIEKGQPRDNLGLTVNYSQGGFNVNLHNQRFGEVTQFALQADGALDQTFGAKWITDVELSYRLGGRLGLAVGANNLFDVYPDQWKDFEQRGPLSNNGIFRYSGISPFGFNGAFYYTRVSLDL
jgi:iron complex outermembrane receptor protein